MKETKIRAVRARTKPKYRTNAAELLEKCRAFYRDEANEQAFQEWKETKKKGA